MIYLPYLQDYKPHSNLGAAAQSGQSTFKAVKLAISECRRLTIMKVPVRYLFH